MSDRIGVMHREDGWNRSGTPWKRSICNRRRASWRDFLARSIGSDGVGVRPESTRVSRGHPGDGKRCFDATVVDSTYSWGTVCTCRCRWPAASGSGGGVAVG